MKSEVVTGKTAGYCAIGEAVNPDVRITDRHFHVRLLCCGAETTLSYRQIHRQMKRGSKQCPACYAAQLSMIKSRVIRPVTVNTGRHIWTSLGRMGFRSASA